MTGKQDRFPATVDTTMVARCKATVHGPMVIALPCAELTAITTQASYTATADMTRIIVGWVATVRLHGVIVLRSAALTVITMQARKCAIMAWMIMDVGWATIAQWNAPWFAHQLRM